VVPRRHLGPRRAAGPAPETPAAYQSIIAGEDRKGLAVAAKFFRLGRLRFCRVAAKKTEHSFIEGGFRVRGRYRHHPVQPRWARDSEKGLPWPVPHPAPRRLPPPKHDLGRGELPSSAKKDQVGGGFLREGLCRRTGRGASLRSFRAEGALRAGQWRAFSIRSSDPRGPMVDLRVCAR